MFRTSRWYHASAYPPGSPSLGWLGHWLAKHDIIRIPCALMIVDGVWPGLPLERYPGLLAAGAGSLKNPLLVAVTEKRDRKDIDRLVETIAESLA